MTSDATNTMTTDARIVIDFTGYWVGGTGAGKGRQADVACHRDRRGLPALPISQVKGTLRETADRMVAAGTLEAEIRNTLLGERSDDVDGREPKQAAIDFLDDAVMPEDAAGAYPDAAAAARLFSRLPQTAMTDDGVAKDRTLRTTEVARPVRLVGQLRVRPGTKPPPDWVDVLDRICAATLAFGKAKTDGLGRAIASAEAVEQPQPADRPTTAPVAISRGGTMVLELRLTQSTRASFSARSATEGTHATLSAPTGASLLGWAAGGGRYGRMEDAFKVFHSGHVRFGDAVPDSGHGTETIPIPRSLAAPKASGGKATAGNRLNTDLVVNGKERDAETRNQDTQYEAIKPGFMTLDLRLLRGKTGQRLRTATRDGRAATGQLFGLQHVEPGAQADFVARIEIDPEVSDNDIWALFQAFDGQELRLGRAKGTGYGGGYHCTASLRAVQPEVLPKGTAGQVRVLALSDIAAVNAFGAPAPYPAGSDLGLQGARFIAAESAVSHRRFAPWNGHLGRRDTERLVIEAGSVLVYDLPNALPADIPARQTIGLWREAGFGRVWLAPPLLAGHRLTAPGNEAEEAQDA